MLKPKEKNTQSCTPVLSSFRFSKYPAACGGAVYYGDVSSNHILDFSELGLYLLMMPIENNWIAIEAKLVFDDEDFSEISEQGNYRLLFQYPCQIDEAFKNKRTYHCEFISVFIEK